MIANGTKFGRYEIRSPVRAGSMGEAYLVEHNELAQTKLPRSHETKWDLWLLRTADKNASPLLQSEFNERQASFSPDGKYIAYTSDKSGSAAVYVQTFPISGSEWDLNRTWSTTEVA